MSESADDFNADTLLRTLPRDRHVLIAGPTASGKSALALAIAERRGGVIVNADAMQVYDGWQVLTARPTPAETAHLPHRLYGHVPFEARYSVGDWLRDLRPLLAGGDRLIITGGTGLYFSALTEGLAPIPPVPDTVRDEAAARLARDGAAALLDEIDAATRGAIDTANPARVRRAWEVRRATGRGLVEWQALTPPPLLAADAATTLVAEIAPATLALRIEARVDAMLRAGALDEVRANLDRLARAPLAGRAIGAPELAAHLRGRMTLEAARGAVITATRRYAKRQRTWMRNRLDRWQRIRTG